LVTKPLEDSTPGTVKPVPVSLVEPVAYPMQLGRAMVRPGGDRWQGRVEVEETFVGGEEDGVRGRRRGDKSVMVIAVEVEGKRIGRIRLGAIPDASAASLHAFIADSVEPGSTLHTDAWPGYKGLQQKGYLCETSVIGKQPKDAVSASWYCARRRWPGVTTVST
jgi:hypothetical protein